MRAARRVALLAAPAAATAAPSLSFAWTDDGAAPFTVRLSDGGPAVRGLPVRVFAGGRWHSSADGSLRAAGPPQGADQRREWTTADGVAVETAVRAPGAGSLLFETRWPRGANGTAHGPTASGVWAGSLLQGGVSSEFPAVDLSAMESAGWGFYDYHGNQEDYPVAGRVGEFGALRPGADSAGGAGGGVLALFAADGARSLVVSAASSFMASNVHPKGGAALVMGVMASAAAIPEGWSTSFVLHHAAGIRPALQSWGALLRGMYNRTDAARRGDMTNSHLGYNTDNGAYYYYKTEDGKGYLETLLDVHAEAVNKSIPFRHLLLDSWWYFQDATKSVTDWSPRPDVFPNGWADFDELRDRTGWAFTMHNRYWSAQNVYAKQNGGNFSFHVEDKYAIPDDQAFWDHLIGGAARHGLATYEQDWLDREYNVLNVTHSDVEIARRWLRQMGRGAERSGVYVQYCMSYPRHLLQSLEVPAVSQARASEDNMHIPYALNNVWIAANAILHDSLGLAPLKDVFLSRRIEGSPLKWSHAVELEYALHALTATLSTGPVTVGDRAGELNAPLIMRSADASGRLLRPSTPGFAIDRWFADVAFSRAAVAEPLQLTRFVQHAACRLPGLAADVVLGFHLRRRVNITPADLHLDDEQERYAVRLGTGAAAPAPAAAAATVAPFSAARPLPLGPTEYPGFDYWQVVRPVGGWLLLGELAKWVPSSPDRITSVDASGGGLRVGVRGAAGERVALSFVPVPHGGVPGAVRTLTCAVGTTGTATFHLTDDRCE